jgi:quercetin dioxygenase-like cupin family protein
MLVLKSPKTPSPDPLPPAASGTITRFDYGEFSGPDGAAFIVEFEPGARTEWHTHIAGQFIYVVEGNGVIVTRDGDHSTLAAGDLVVVPAGETHWHGAEPKGSMKHVTVSLGDSQRHEAVDDQTYRSGVLQAAEGKQNR